MNNQPRVIPVASGKGGVGKSVLTANLGIALAQKGFSTVLVDLDLGGSNLYTCLGLPNKYPGIGRFIKSRTLDLNDLQVPAGTDNLKFIPGEDQTPFMANISYEQRTRLVREIRKIQADFILLDLGAGTQFTTLHFFGISRRGIVLTTFETTSIMNLVVFLRNFMFRVLTGVVGQDKKMLKNLAAAFHQPESSGPLSVQTLIGRIEKKQPELALRVMNILRKYHPRIVFNMGNHPSDLKVLPRISEILKNGLSLETEYIGLIFEDDTVRKAAKNREVLLKRYPQCPAAKGIRRIADHIARFTDSSLENSIDVLQKQTAIQYQTGREEILAAKLW